MKQNYSVPSCTALDGKTRKRFGLLQTEEGRKILWNFR